MRKGLGEMTTGNRTNEPNKYAGFLARQNHQRDSHRGIGVKCLCGRLFDLDADHALHQVEEIMRAALVAAASVAPVQPSSTVDEGKLADVIAKASLDYNLSDRSGESYACGAPDYRSAFIARAVVEAIGGEGE